MAALDRLISEKGKPYEVYNIGTGNGNSVFELIKTFEEATGRKLAYTIGARRPGDVPKIYADATLADRMLGWKANRTLAESMETSWRWQQSLT